MLLRHSYALWRRLGEFDDIDTNHDGVITVDEVRDALARRGASNPPKRSDAMDAPTRRSLGNNQSHELRARCTHYKLCAYRRTVLSLLWARRHRPGVCEMLPPHFSPGDPTAKAESDRRACEGEPRSVPRGLCARHAGG